MPEASAESTATPAQLWSVLADLGRWAERVPTVDAVRHLSGPEPPDVGSRFEISQPGLPTAVYEITEWKPGSRFVWQSRARGLVSTAAHTVVATPSGSRLDLRFDWTGPLSAPVRAIGTRRAEQMMASEAAALARIAEAG